MSPVETIAQLLETHVGFKRSRVLQVARALSEGGLIASGGPGRAPEFSRDDVVAILVGVATGAKIESVAETTRAVLATTPGGADVRSAPLCIPRNAEIQLAVLASMSLAGDSLEGLTIEVVHGWPEVALIWADGKVQRFQAAGSVANSQPSSKSRVAARIAGDDFASFIKEATAHG
ncbi:hypothetical protein [Rhizobium sp. Rhizsp82]|uniref:hypothetical protein n=1 Tax=Rhizobium sp. Rhizsp82 TaxID=3243057 RepID=UPI0039B54927